MYLFIYYNLMEQLKNERKFKKKKEKPLGQSVKEYKLHTKTDHLHIN